MKAIIFFLLVAVFAKVPKIDLYFESLCPGCQEFITTSFKKYLDFNHMGLCEFNFWPYGNAHERYDEAQQKWIFTCQHGDNECYGNLIDTCSIDVMGRFASYKTIHCIESVIDELDEDFDAAVKKCIPDNSLRKLVMECVTGKKGNELEHKVAQQTPASHKYVPWITVDDVWDEEIQNKIEDDMVGYLCSLPTSDCDNQSKFLEIIGLKKDISKCYHE